MAAATPPASTLHRPSGLQKSAAGPEQQPTAPAQAQEREPQVDGPRSNEAQGQGTWVTDTVSATAQLLLHLKQLDVRLCEYRARCGAGVDDRTSLSSAASQPSYLAAILQQQVTDVVSCSQQSQGADSLSQAAASEPGSPQRQLQEQQSRTQQSPQPCGHQSLAFCLQQSSLQQDRHNGQLAKDVESVGEEVQDAATRSRTSSNAWQQDSLCTTSSMLCMEATSPSGVQQSSEANLAVPQVDIAGKRGFLTLDGLAADELARLRGRSASTSMPQYGSAPPSSTGQQTAMNEVLDEAMLQTLSTPEASGLLADAQGARSAAAHLDAEAVPRVSSISSRPSATQVMPAAAASSSSSGPLLLSYGSQQLALSTSQQSALRKLSGLLHLSISRCTGDLTNILKVPRFSDEQNCIAVRALLAAATSLPAPAAPQATLGLPSASSSTPTASTTTPQPEPGRPSSYEQVVAPADAMLVWRAADYYQVDALKWHCEDVLIQTLSQLLGISNMMFEAPAAAAAQSQQQPQQGATCGRSRLSGSAGSASSRHRERSLDHGDDNEACTCVRAAQHNYHSASSSQAEELNGHTGRGRQPTSAVAVQFVQESAEEHVGGSRVQGSAIPLIGAAQASMPAQAEASTSRTPHAQHNDCSTAGGQPGETDLGAVLKLLTEILDLVNLYQYAAARLQHLVAVWMMSHMQLLVSSRPLAALLSRHKGELVPTIVAETRERLLSVVMLSDTLDEDDA